MTDVIKPNRDFYVSSTSVAFDGTANGTSAGVGSGTLASRPATCTTGVGYWATDAGGSWNVENGTSSDGALYVCSATNTWSLYYTPYAFPHYVEAASTTGTDLVDIGAGARMFGNGKFYGFSTSTASGVYATIGATTTPITSTTASSSADYYLDLTVQTWSNSGTHHKAWTETSTTLGATTTHHMIGDLTANTQYALKIDGAAATSNVSSPQCSAGTCTSNSSGVIYFDYTGGYSTHTFDLVQGSAAAAPTLLAPVLSSITSSGATASSTVTDVGGSNATSTGFAYGLTTAYGATTTPSVGSYAAGTVLSASFSGLSCGTAYHIAAFATNANGIGYSSDATFTTSSCSKPTVSTSEPTLVASSTLTFAGNLVSTGGASVTDGGLTWGTVATLSGGDTATSSFGSLSVTGPFSGGFVGLTPNTTYYVRAYAANTGGLAVGAIVSTTTLPVAAPALTTSAASSVGQTAATLSASISNYGQLDATQSGFAYGTSSDLSAVTATSTLGVETGNASFSSALSSLTCNTTYYFRPYAVNTSGTGYGTILAFTTSACSAAANGGGSSSNNSAVSPIAARPGSAHRSSTVAPATPVSSTALSAISLRSFIQVLIASGVIPQGKAAQALSIVSAPSVSPSSSVPSHDLQYRDRNSSVRSLQAILSTQGYLKAAPNGVFGPATLSALKSFQKDHGVPATGYYGPLTRAALSALR